MILRSLLFFTLATGCIAGATITTQVTCDGVVYNTSACSDSQASASVTISAAGHYLDSVNLGIAAYGSAGTFPLLPLDVLAIGTFRGAYVFTVTGGSGSGLVGPCITVDKSNYAGGGVAQLSFGRTEFGNNGSIFLDMESCQDPTASVDVGRLPFTFGVPQMVIVSMQAVAQAVNAPSQVDYSASLDGFQFFDDSGNQLSNVHFSLVSTTVPEPGMWFPLLAIFLVLFGQRVSREQRSGIRRYLL